MLIRYSIPLLILVQVTSGAPLPIGPFSQKYEGSVQLVVSPSDFEKGSIKAHSIKNNLKNSIKQKMLDVLLPKEVQDLSPIYDPDTGDIVGLTQFASVSGASEVIPRPTRQTIEVKIDKPGMLSTIMKTPDLVEHKVLEAGTEKTVNIAGAVDEDEEDSDEDVFEHTKQSNGHRRLAAAIISSEDGVIGYTPLGSQERYLKR